MLNEEISQNHGSGNNVPAYGCESGGCGSRCRPRACVGREPVSEEVIALENTIKKAELPANSVKANLYFDNTQSMYGYINAASNFAVACGDLIETVKGYANYSMNALVRKDNVLGGQCRHI